MDRFPKGTGPIRLEDIKISKKASHKYRRIGTIPDTELDSWLATCCKLDKIPTQKGALRFAAKLQPTNSRAKTGKPNKPKKSDKPLRTSSPDAPTAESLVLLENAQEHLKTVARQLEPLYEQPARPLKPFQLHLIKRYLQEVIDTIGQLRDCQL